MRYFDLKSSWPSYLLGTASCAALLASFGLAGCPDTQGQFDDFVKASEPFRFTPTAGECTAPIDNSGTYVMGAAVVVDPTKPLRFKMELTVDLDASTIDATLQAIAVPPNNGSTAPGTLVGNVYSASTSLDATGKFALDFGSIDVPLEANPILPAPVTATFKLEGCTSTATDACGIVTGQITAPAQIPLDGSTWAIATLPDGADPMSVELQTACP